ncbi:peptide deformylase [bacterium]|jgi:peptide deformylase|nr:peptide deformylase [Ascidiaceihabitans sp.]MCO4839039.1 peptide deformylase [Paracoccaceae bacterium]MDA9135889.1 peptide deformylase [Ascidiaceihabitans sp.]MDB4186010.1 peptide deformylase [bacterium]HCI08866.1 peptide deformylase [Sulfitobacter sp.]
MTVRPFVSWPDKRLRTAVPEVSEITDEIRLIWADMVETMDAMPGVGLAAPQIGVMMQLAVVDASPDRKRRILLANPTILSASEEMNTHDEASPNLPGVSAIIKRPKNVSVRFLNEDGVITRGDFTGLEATSVQHQIDHLQGKMYFDNLGRVKRDMLLRKARKT